MCVGGKGDLQRGMVSFFGFLQVQRVLITIAGESSKKGRPIKIVRDGYSKEGRMTRGGKNCLNGGKKGRVKETILPLVSKVFELGEATKSFGEEFFRC